MKHHHIQMCQTIYWEDFGNIFQLLRYILYIFKSVINGNVERYAYFRHGSIHRV